MTFTPTPEMILAATYAYKHHGFEQCCGAGLSAAIRAVAPLILAQARTDNAERFAALLEAAEIARECGHVAGREYGGVTATRIESAIRALAEKAAPSVTWKRFLEWDEKESVYRDASGRIWCEQDSSPPPGLTPLERELREVLKDASDFLNAECDRDDFMPDSAAELLNRMSAAIAKAAKKERAE